MTDKLVQSPPTVSVIVLTYNHELVLHEAIEGVLSQAVTFPFEIIIAEDASTDRTLDVAFEYKRRFPDLIKIATGAENVGANKNLLRAIAQCRGKYIAICEGDDYWIDSRKLALQVEQLDNHPELSLCFTRGLMLSPDGAKKPGWDYGSEAGIVTARRYLRRSLMPTASLLFHADRLRRLPSWFSSAPVGDIFMVLAAIMPHGALYLPDITVVYRLGTPGSWSTQMLAEWEERKAAHAFKMLKAFDQAVESYGLNSEWLKLRSCRFRLILLRECLYHWNVKEACAHAKYLSFEYIFRKLIRQLIGNSLRIPRIRRETIALGQPASK